MQQLIDRTKVFLHSYRDNIKFWSEILASFATMVSAIIVVFTLHEMQVQRNNAYMPDIIFETVTVNISWGEPEKLNATFIDTELETNPSSVHIPSRNIGVGVAKKITYSLDSSNYISLLSVYNELMPENQYTYNQNGNFLSIHDGNGSMGFNANCQSEKVFLLPAAEEAYDFVLPMQYTTLLQEIYSSCHARPRRNPQPVNIPDIKLNVSFEDVQGVKYSKTIPLAIEILFFAEDEDGNGMATYQIVME